MKKYRKMIQNPNHNHNMFVEKMERRTKERVQ